MTKECDMNVVILFLVAASQDPRLKVAQQLSYLSKVKLATMGRPVVQLDRGRCSIPLTNTLQDKVFESRMPVVEPKGQFNMPVVMPAPPCENWGK
jgi:hypothetical protein